MQLRRLRLILSFVKENLYKDLSYFSAEAWRANLSKLRAEIAAAQNTGPKGDPGTPGTPGTNGSTLYSGSGVPSGSLGSNGDYYFRTSNGAVYLKAAGTWSVIANITGPAGPTALVWHDVGSNPYNIDTASGQVLVLGLGATINMPAGLPGGWYIWIDGTQAVGDFPITLGGGESMSGGCSSTVKRGYVMFMMREVDSGNWWSFQVPSNRVRQTGTATLALGTVTVTPAFGYTVTGSNIQLTLNTPGGTLGYHYSAALADRTASVFVINSVDLAGALVNTDTSTIDWALTTG